MASPTLSGVRTLLTFCSFYVLDRAMSPPDATLSSASAADLQDRQASHGWRMRMLEVAAERGLNLLDEVRDMARERTAEGDLGLTYSRITKSIRQCVMLHAKFEEEAGKSDAQREAEAAAARAAEAQRAASAEAGCKAHRKRQAKKAVKLAMDLSWQAADERGEQLDYAEMLLDLNERIDDYDDYSDFGSLPVGAVVENICRVMGLEFDPALWEDEPWAVAEMAEKPEGSPYADWEPSAPETANDDDDLGEDDETDPYGLADEYDEPPRRSSRAPP
ncbi:MAG TPA: hypothetical protein VH722_21840 [Alphaproteobacteria bacterium]|nr:hypothetical protein [Alphaproteobacteria bacterium]